jgi:hypothetical protein
METVANWDKSQRVLLLKAIKRPLDKGKGADAGLKKEAWTRVLLEFNRNAKKNLKKLQLQNQHTALKSQYLVFQALVENSGFGWNEMLQIPTAPAETWDAYLLAHPKATKYRFETLPPYTELHEVFTGTVATGSNASDGNGFGDQEVSEEEDMFESQSNRSTTDVSIHTPPVTPVATPAKRARTDKKKAQNLAESIQALGDSRVKAALIQQEGNHLSHQ